MKRRTFFTRFLSGLGLIPAAPVVGAAGREVLIQESPIAGVQFHRAEALWPLLSVGQIVELAREPSNPHDANAVAVHFNGQQLGYVPRGENQVVAQMLDRGERLEASIVRLVDDEDPWRRIRISISLV